MKLIDRIKQAAEKRPTKQVPLKELLYMYEGDEVVGLRALTIGEETEAETAAARAKNESLSGLHEATIRVMSDMGFFTARHVCERLARACRDSERPEVPAFESAEDLMGLFPDDVAAFTRALAQCASPRETSLPTEMLDDLLDRIGKTDGEYPTVDYVLSTLPAGTLIDALVRAAKRLAASEGYAEVRGALEGEATD